MRKYKYLNLFISSNCSPARTTFAFEPVECCDRISHFQCAKYIPKIVLAIRENLQPAWMFIQYHNIVRISQIRRSELFTVLVDIRQLPRRMNFTSFIKNYYRYGKTDAVARGSPISPIAGDLFLSSTESKALIAFIRSRVRACGMLMTSLRSSVQPKEDRFVQFLNKRFSSTNFAMEMEDPNTIINFLDCGPKLNDAFIYRKPAHLHMHLRFNPAQPQRVKRTFAFSLTDRVEKPCNGDTDREAELRRPNNILRENHYPPRPNKRTNEPTYTSNQN